MEAGGFIERDEAEADGYLAEKIGAAVSHEELIEPERAYEYLAMADGALYSFTIAMKKRQAPSLAAAAA